MSAPDPDGRKWWLDDDRNVDKVYYAVVFICVMTVVADLFYHKHGHYHFEQLPGFHAAYGFVSCVLLVLAAKELRKLIMRDERYYDDPAYPNLLEGEGGHGEHSEHHDHSGGGHGG